MDKASSSLVSIFLEPIPWPKLKKRIDSFQRRMPNLLQKSEFHKLRVEAKAQALQLTSDINYRTIRNNATIRKESLSVEKETVISANIGTSETKVRSLTKGLVGKKNNQPAYFIDAVSYLISKEYLEQFVIEGAEVTIHPEKYTLNVPKYKEELWKCIEPLIEVYGVAEIELVKLKEELLR